MGKRNIGRFCIQFNNADARHLQAVDILEAQGRRKAQFITEAILHYTNCTETPKIKPQQNPAILKKIVEGIVRELLKKDGNPQAAANANNHSVMADVPGYVKGTALEEEIDAELLASIQESMGALRDEAGNRGSKH